MPPEMDEVTEGPIDLKTERDLGPVDTLVDRSEPEPCQIQKNGNEEIIPSVTFQDICT